MNPWHLFTDFLGAVSLFAMAYGLLWLAPLIDALVRGV